MVVDRDSMNNVEKQILHDANDLFFIRIVAFDWTQCLRQNAIDSPRHILQFLHEEFGPWGLTGFGFSSLDDSRTKSSEDGMLSNDKCQFLLEQLTS